MSSSFLQQLLARGDTWQGRRSDVARTGGISTGFPSLDRLLRDAGWPRQGLIEWLCPLPCPPALHLLLPLLAAAGPGMRLLANPPAQPSALALAAAGVPLERLLVLHSHDRGALLRACLEAACSDVLGTLALWTPAGALPTGTLRRLHLGAQQGRCLAILLRPLDAARHPSPAPLRLQLGCPVPGELDVTVLKQPGDRPGGHCRLVVLPGHLRQAPPSCATQIATAHLPRVLSAIPIPATPATPATHRVVR